MPETAGQRLPYFPCLFASGRPGGSAGRSSQVQGDLHGDPLSDGPALHAGLRLPEAQAGSISRSPIECQGEILSLPMYPELSDGQIEYVAQAIKEFYAK